MKKVYITKLALKTGRIYTALVKNINNDGEASCILANGATRTYKKGDWHLSLEEALKKVEEDKEKRIARCSDRIRSYESELHHYENFTQPSIDDTFAE